MYLLAIMGEIRVTTISTAVDVFGDRVVTFVGVSPGQLDENPLQFVMTSRRLADGYRKFFEFMWDHCR
ncbi:hypothetical protein KKG55_03390 [Candidatus Micrarchaeota archaeon]|nr:hypothetical protein [Candidatus Micrarchaeota archaeon]MBU1886752.1 hypothetical protein [Candidatus Micrarchaeota archaeon]